MKTVHTEMWRSKHPEAGRSPTVMHTVVIDKSSDFCKRVYKNCFIICGVSRGITHQKYNVHILNERF